MKSSYHRLIFSILITTAMISKGIELTCRIYSHEIKRAKLVLVIDRHEYLLMRVLSPKKICVDGISAILLKNNTYKWAGTNTKFVRTRKLSRYERSIFYVRHLWDKCLHIHWETQATALDMFTTFGWVWHTFLVSELPPFQPQRFCCRKNLFKLFCKYIYLKTLLLLLSSPCSIH